jgi:urease alpha subunit
MGATAPLFLVFDWTAIFKGNVIIKNGKILGCKEASDH